ncbi:MAG: hypothetical protein AB7K09_06925 [Planctomycetota bacterium]
MQANRTSLLLAVVAALVVLGSAGASQTAVAQDPSSSTEQRQHEQLKLAMDTKKIDMDFDEVALSDVIEFIRNRASVSIVLDPKVGDEVADEPITLTLKNITLANAMRIILDFVELTWTYRHGVIWITSAEEAWKGRTVLHIYDVRDLTMKIRNFAGTRIRLRGDESGQAGPIWIEDEPIVEPTDVDTLTDIIPEVVARDSWSDNPEASIITVMGMLVIRQTPEVHQEIAKLLAQLRQNR